MMKVESHEVDAKRRRERGEKRVRDADKKIRRRRRRETLSSKRMGVKRATREEERIPRNTEGGWCHESE